METGNEGVWGGQGPKQPPQSPPLLGVQRGGDAGRLYEPDTEAGPCCLLGGCGCLRFSLLIGIMWGSGRSGDSCDRRDASRWSARLSPAPQPRPAAGGREAAGTRAPGKPLTSPHPRADLPAAAWPRRALLPAAPRSSRGGWWLANAQLQRHAPCLRVRRRFPSPCRPGKPYKGVTGGDARLPCSSS